MNVEIKTKSEIFDILPLENNKNYGKIWANVEGKKKVFKNYFHNNLFYNEEDDEYNMTVDKESFEKLKEQLVN